MARILIAIDGSEEDTYFRRVATFAPLDGAELVLLAHVIDVVSRAGVELGRDRYLGRRRLGLDRAADLGEAEQERARAGLQRARQVLEEAGISGRQVRIETLRGKPGESLLDLVEREGIDVIVVGGRPGMLGPHSVGKTARFLIDHAPRAVMLVR